MILCYQAAAILLTVVRDPQGSALEARRPDEPLGYYAGPSGHPCIFMRPIRRRVLICIPIRHRPRYIAHFRFFAMSLRLFAHYIRLWFNVTVNHTAIYRKLHKDNETSITEKRKIVERFSCLEQRDWYIYSYRLEYHNCRLYFEREKENFVATWDVPRVEVNTSQVKDLPEQCFIVVACTLRLNCGLRSLSRFYCFILNQNKCLCGTF